MIFRMHERVPGELKTYNTVLTINDVGEIMNIYRKMMLYDAFGMRESNDTIPGKTKPKVFRINNVNIGVMVCYEVRFPEIARSLALDGAELIVIPSAWVKGYNKEDIWISTVKARAMENTVYIGTSNQIGNIFTGISVFADPLGILVQRATEEEGIFIQYVSKERIKYARKILPLLEQRKYLLNVMGPI
mgnify:CR=1 FL=1